MTIEDLKQLRESEDHVGFKAARHNYPFAGGSHSDPRERRRCVLGYVVALANECGGRLVLGMEDARPHSVCGSDFAQGETGNLEAAVYKALGVRVQTCELFEDGKRVLVVEVPSRPVGRLLKFEGVQLMVDGKLTYAALILLGKKEAIRKWLPQNNVVVEFRYDPASIQFDARREFQLPLFLGIDAIWAYLNQPLSNPMSHIGDAPYIFDVHKFTEDTVREAVLNAITHRSMQIKSDVVIKQSTRDLVITNAGGFPLGVDLSNILTVNSNPRQKLVAEVLQKTGLVEKSGQGVDKMFSLCVMESKPLPDYSGTDAYQVSLKLGAEIRDEAFVVFVHKEQAKRPVGKKLNVFDLMVLYSVRFGGRLPDGYNRGSLERLVDEGLVVECADGYVLGGDYAALCQKMAPFAKEVGKSPGASELTDRQKAVYDRIVAFPAELAEDMAKALSLGRRTLDRETAVLRKLGYIRKSDKDNRSPWVVLK